MTAERLLPLIRRIPLLATPVRAHGAESDIESVLKVWAARSDLVTVDRLGFLAARTFPDAKTDDVVLWARWLALLADPRGDGARTCSAVLAGRRDRKPLAPADKALRELWTVTAPRVGPTWRRRFVGKLDLHQAACTAEAANRRRGRIPSPSEYVVLRRGTFGAHVFDLIEAVLRTEVPARLLDTSTWRTLYEGSIDIAAWCTDIARAETSTDNFVAVAGKAFGMPTTAAIDWVAERIIERSAQVRAAVLTLPGLYDRCGFDRPAATYLSRVACALVTLPRAHIEWWLTSARPADVPEPRQAVRQSVATRR
ncbi:MAG TPA: terpene synthase family protein [Pseudonocardiaceae bacterium]|nr:terpene synthase family protein [Pseudonocardiaceae bacterium]